MKSIQNFENQKGPKQLSDEFSANVSKAIELLGKNKTELDNKSFLQLLLDNEIPNEDAIEILLFLPIAFVRCLLKNIRWPELYVDCVNEKYKVEKKYSDTPSYQVIWHITTEYFKKSPCSDVVLKIAGRSAEFQAANKLLLNNSNSKVEEIKFSLTMIIR